MKRRQYGFMCILLAWLLTGVAPFCAAQEYVFRSFRQAHGLSNLTITTMTSDARGSLWVGTQNGLYRFLGDSFQRFGFDQGIREKYIGAVVGAPDGTLWVGTSKNLYRWNGVGFEPAASMPIPIGDAASIAAENPGHLLLIVNNQIQRLSYGANGRLINLRSIFEDRFAGANPHFIENRVLGVSPDHRIWMACGPLLCEWQDGQLRLWDKQHGVPEELYSSFAFTPDGSVWVAGEGHLIELARGDSAFVDRTPASYRSSQQFFAPAVAVDHAGRIVIATDAILQRWEGGSWHSFGKANGLGSGSITDLLVDANGNLWTGTFGSGVQEWVGYEDWEGWTDRQGLPSSSVWSIESRNPSHITVGTEKGLATIDPKTGRVALVQTDKWRHGAISALSTGTTGTSLLGTVDGDLFRLRPGSRHVETIAKLKTFIYTIFREASGRTYLLNYRYGILEVNENNPARPPAIVPEVQSLFSEHTRLPIGKACSSPDGGTWFPSWSGMLQHSGELWRRVPVDGLPPNYELRGVTCARDGTLWLSGRESGIWRAVPAGDRLRASEFKLPSAAASYFVLDTLVDSRNWLWLATDNGLLVWNGSSWRHLTQETGLIWNDLNQFNLTETRDGSIWAGTSGGVAHLTHPEHVFGPAPRIQMIEIRRDDQALPSSGEVRLSWASRGVSFQFAEPNFLNRSDLVFWYRVSGLQTAWTETRETTASFTSLPSGHYSFEVYAEDRISGLRSPVLSVPMQIIPPWWRSLWAYDLYAVLGALLLWLFVRWRTRRVVLQKQRLEALIAVRTEQLEISREQLRIQATHDGLTGLLNRNAILEAFHTEILRAHRERGAVTLVLADLDHFKKINDTYGHAAGDEAIRRFAAALSCSARPYDYVGRYGGEEFLLVLTGIETCLVHERLAALHRSITDIDVMDGVNRFVVTCSLGAVCSDFKQPQVAATLVAAADEALYEAKKTGRNRFVLRGLSGTATTNDDPQPVSVTG